MTKLVGSLIVPKTEGPGGTITVKVREDEDRGCGSQYKEEAGMKSERRERFLGRELIG